MKTLIVHSSRETGNSRKIAEALAAAVPDAVSATAAEAPSPEKFDLIAFCFGIYRGWPDGDMIEFMKRTHHKDVALFMTLGAWSDSEHAFRCLGRAEGLLETDVVRARFICQGGYTQAYLKHMKSLPANSPHGWNPEREERVMEAMKHPSEADCANAVAALLAAQTKLANAKPNAPRTEAKRAVVLSVFGTSYPEAAKAYDALEESIRARTELPVFRAYTSRKIRSKLNNAVPSLSAVLKRLVTEGFTEAEIVAAYLAAGEEYELVANTAAAFGRSLKLHLNRPPLENLSLLRDFLKLVPALIPAERKPGESVLFMGHGNGDGRSDFAYTALNAELEAIDPDFHAACVEGEPDFESTAARLKPGRVWLLPFLIVAGDHARNDLAGEEADSWRSILTAHGFDVRTILKGLGENRAVADWFAKELK